MAPSSLLAATATTVGSPPSGGSDGVQGGFLWLAGVLAAGLVIRLVASWAEDRGWVHYRRPGRGGGGAALSNAMAEFDAVLNPAAEHRLEEQRSQQVIREETAQTDDDAAGSRDRDRGRPLQLFVTAPLQAWRPSTTGCIASIASVVFGQTSHLISSNPISPNLRR